MYCRQLTKACKLLHTATQPAFCRASLGGIVPSVAPAPSLLLSPLPSFEERFLPLQRPIFNPTPHQAPEEASLAPTWLPNTATAQAVETSVGPNHTDAMREGSPRMKTCATAQTAWAARVSGYRPGARLPHLSQAPSPLRPAPSSAVRRRPRVSSSQVAGRISGT